MAAKNDPAGLGRVSAMEKNNYQQGRSGSKVPIKPAVVRGVRNNGTNSGGINRATRGGGR